MSDDLVERAAVAARDREAIRTAADVLDRSRDRVDREFVHQVVIHADDLIAGPLRTEHDAIVRAFTELRSASGGRSSSTWLPSCAHRRRPRGRSPRSEGWSRG